MRKYYGLLLLCLLLSSWTMTDGFREQFRKAFLTNDAPAVEKALTDWEQATPRDPDLYVAQFNWLLKKGEQMELRAGKAMPGSISIQRKKGKPVGQITSGYNPELAEQAAQALKKGLTFAPDRLDMYFGLAKLYEMTGQPQQQLETLRTALAHRPPAGQEWRWRDGGKLPVAEAEFVPGSLEQYAGFYWQQDGKDALENARALAELIEQYYPQSSLGFFNTGVYYSITGQRAKAYAKMQQADALAPNDPSTISNLTKLAIQLKHKAEATRYLAKLKELPDTEQAVTDLTRQLRKL